MLSVAPVLTTPIGLSQPYVLLVDDHEPSLETLRLVLETVGYDCVSTNSAPEALEYCDTRQPTLVVTDLRMPRIDGRCLARWLQARYPAMPIVLVTGEPLDSPTLRMLERTFVAVLSKPIAVESFLGLVADLLPPSR
jgi:two-component system cell cycle sensor histidine kinase/response regulator CckA